jgi:hypothetical protein
MSDAGCFEELLRTLQSQPEGGLPVARHGLTYLA